MEEWLRREGMLMRQDDLWHGADECEAK
ncbi:hypothetical protein A2U01_0024996, partial [Trifolium medium]|nr:hypothetical protein [Trifolium medium]